MGHALVSEIPRVLDIMQLSRTYTGTPVLYSGIEFSAIVFKELPSACSVLGLMSGPLVLV